MSKEQERVNIYAVVIDASSPYYIESIKKYLCVLKLIDDSLNPKSKGKTPFMNLTCFSQSKNEIPNITKLGSIIRIHRGDTKKYNKSFQLNCDSGIKGSWVIFDPSDTPSPTDHSEIGRAHV